MADSKSAVAGDRKNGASFDKVAEIIRKQVTRRQFLKGTGAVGLGVTTFYLMGCGSSGSAAQDDPRQIYVADARGMIIQEPSRCVGCRRCELACTEFNDGKSQPAISRVKVGRNYNLGPLEAQRGLMRENGTWGNSRIIADTCRQCPHPVPCQLACPQGAIEAVAPLNARVVNVDKCVGCGICTQACPWDMISLDKAARKATKCTLCKECVNACPAGALQYVPWSDKTKQIPPRVIVPASIQMPPDVAASCAKCH